MSTSVLKALPGKFDIKKHLPSFLYLYSLKVCFNSLHAVLFCCFVVLFFKITFFKKNLLAIPSELSNSLDPDQAPYFIEPDQLSNCLQKSSADDASR